MRESHETPRLSRRPAASGCLSDGRLFELVLDPIEKRTHFAVGRGEAISTVPSIQDGGVRFVPIAAENNLVKHGVLVLPERPEHDGGPQELVADIERYIDKYVDLSDHFRGIAAYYVLLTWVYDAFNELPYLRLRGDYGSGKTRALLVLGAVCNKGFFASGASTVSPIFHTLDTFRGTLILDEADFRFSDEKAELVKILNNGNVRGFPVLRTAVSARKEFDPRAFHVFGPKIVAMRRSFEDPALESRFLTEEMGQRGLRADIPINLPPSQETEAKALRSRLLGYRFRTLHHIRPNESLVDPTLSSRLNQILVPLLSIIEDEALRDDLRKRVGAFDQGLVAERAASPEAGVLEVVRDLMRATDRAGIPLAEVTAAFVARHGQDYARPITGRYIGGILRQRLHIASYKSHGVFVIPSSERARIEHLCLRYGVVDEGLG